MKYTHYIYEIHTIYQAMCTSKVPFLALLAAQLKIRCVCETP